MFLNVQSLVDVARRYTEAPAMITKNCGRTDFVACDTKCLLQLEFVDLVHQDVILPLLPSPAIRHLSMEVHFSVSETVCTSIVRVVDDKDEEA
jgi:hypothetical protein